MYVYIYIYIVYIYIYLYIYIYSFDLQNFKNTHFVVHQRTAASEKQQLNYRFQHKKWCY